ncbi:alpha-L-arabinofuranosidase [Arthrobacter sp. UYEF6]
MHLDSIFRPGASPGTGFIESVIATADAVRAKGKHKRHINLSLDKWNVWSQRDVDTEDQQHNVANAGWREHPRDKCQSDVSPLS